MSMDRMITKKKWPPRRIVAYSLVAAFVLLVAYLLLFQSHRATLNVEAEKLTISTVQRGPFQEFIPIMGEVLPMQTIFLDVEEGGLVETIYIEAGSAVRKGDKILKLSNTSLLMDIMYREAELFQQINNLRNTRLLFEQNRLSLKRELADLDFQVEKQRRKFESYQSLYAEKLVSRHEFEDTRDEFELVKTKRQLAAESQEKDLNYRQQQIGQLEDSVRRMEENLRIAKGKLDNLTVRAPIGGTLTSLQAEPGQSKSPGERLGQIDAPEGFKARAEIDEFYIDRVQKGKPGQFELSGNTHHMVVTRVYPEVRGGKFSVDLEFRDRQAPGIRRGQTLHIRLELSDVAEALLLPRGGFFQKTGGNWAFVVEPDGKTAIKRDIRLGRQNPDVFEVLGGLHPGDRVVTSSYDSFGDNERLVLK
ncbi:MAG: HlyD family efflux transporter periplasmic adaptor subunit [Candidatus Aminicenantes bacterium]|nr:HlyD family efflux transporter periplasmic adaptor subunit [Candidatus Aminicenantes bacterium]